MGEIRIMGALGNIGIIFKLLRLPKLTKFLKFPTKTESGSTSLSVLTHFEF